MQSGWFTKGRRWLIVAVVWAAANLVVSGQSPVPAESIDEPDEAARWIFDQRAFPLGYIPKDAKRHALQQIEQHRKFRGQKPLTQISVASVPGNAWVSIGPSPMLNGQIGVTLGARPMNGRVSAIAANPGNTNHWLVGGAQSGVWQTFDAGTTWAPLTDGQASLAIGSVAFAPGNTNIIYAGTGEGNGKGADVYLGQGLLKSLDGGTTWQLMATSFFADASIVRVFVNPTNANIVVVAFNTLGGFGRPPTQPPPFSNVNAGIYKSTDGGTNWAAPFNVLGQATDVQVDPGNFNRQYGGIGNPGGDTGNGVRRTLDAWDTATTVLGPWSNAVAASAAGRVQLVIAPSNPNVVYVSIANSSTASPHPDDLLGLWKTTNAWAATPSWTPISVAATDDGTGFYGFCGWSPAGGGINLAQCWYNLVLSVDPANPNVLYAGGIPLWKYDGTSWTEVSKTVADPAHGIHVDQHALAWAGTRLIAGNDGGVWSSPDGGATWADHNAGLALTQIYNGALHPTNASIAIAGTQDNGSQQWNGSNAWNTIFGGDGADAEFSATSPDMSWAVSNPRLFIWRTTDGGASYTNAEVNINHLGAPFICKFKRCPDNNNTFIAGTTNMWASVNFFSATPPTWFGIANSGLGAGISAMAWGPPGSSCSIWAFGTADGQLRITTNGGTTLNNPNQFGVVPNRYISDMAFHPSNSNILYVALSGFDEGSLFPGHLYKTTNALAAFPSWSNVTPPVNIPHNAVVLDPSDGNIVYVGTDIGVWKSIDAGASWTHMGPGEGMPNVAVFDLKMNATTGRLVAFTHGRGAFMLAPGPGGTNSWIDSAGGAWEDAVHWSVASPAISESLLYITNATTKIVTLQDPLHNPPGTSALTVSNLVLSAPANSTNTLQISNLTSGPLTFLSSLTISNGGVALLTNATLRVNGLASGTVNVDGRLTLRDNASVTFTPRMLLGRSAGAAAEVWVSGGSLVLATNDTNFIGVNNAGQLTISNGTLLASQVQVGNNAGSQGTFTIAGGNSQLTGVLFLSAFGGSTGIVRLMSGQLQCQSLFVANTNNCQGIYVQTGGTNTVTQFLSVGHLAGSVGAAWISGGALVVTNNSSFIGELGTGQLTVSNGSVLTRNLFIGANPAVQGSLTVAGGTTVASNLVVGVYACNGTSTVMVSAGNLFVTNATGTAVLEIRSGTLTQSGGVLVADKLVITNACGRFLRTAGVFSADTTNLSPNLSAVGDGIPNSWKQQYGIDPFNPAAANADLDGDGLSNFQEYLAGTDPTNSASFIGITAVAREANNVRVTWMTGLNKTNALERTAGGAGSFATNNFTAIFTVTNTVGTVTNFLDIGAATNAPAFYYRVRLVP